jgi:AAA ATPase domain
MASAGTEAPLLERDVELAAFDSALGAARQGRGSFVYVTGPAGAGKTALLRRARALAGSAGFAVLSATGSQLERDFAFGVVRQLLEGPSTAPTRPPASASSAGRPPSRSPSSAPAPPPLRATRRMRACTPSTGWWRT